MPEFLEISADKFTFRVAKDRLYTREGEWMQFEPSTQRARIGLSDYPQQHNGDVAFASVKPVGTRLAVGELFSEIETIKAMVELHSPISGTIVEVNQALETTPELINESPYEAGWLVVIEVTNWDIESATLLPATEYLSLVKAQIQEELRER